MPRKTHKKSRNGCIQCKSRHIKCDEYRPECVQCQTVALSCEYSRQRRYQDRAASLSTESPVVVTPNTSVTTSSTPATLVHDEQQATATIRPLNPTELVTDLSNMELLHHFCTVTYETLSPEAAQQRTWQYAAVKMGLCFPFLLHEILAISALHLAYCKPESQRHYCRKATELQNLALSGFDAVRDKADSSSCGAILLFASLLALHVLADESHFSGIDTNSHLDHLLDCLTLTTGVRKLAVWDWNHDLQESELKPLLQIPRLEPPYNIPEQCRHLDELTQNSDLSPASIEAYTTAIERLQWVFALSDVPSQTHSSIRWLLAWPIQLQDDYISLLNARRAEALIILAYYGVVLHAYRESWLVRNSGVILIRAISAHLGRYWDPWLAWPKEIVHAE